MKRSILSLLICVCACVYSLPALSWGQEGHRIIAKIAYDHLTCKARKNVDKILGKGGMIYGSTWPDEIKSDTIYPDSYDWHFQDLDGGMSDSAVVATLTHYPAEGGNLFRALDSLVAIKDKDAATMRFIIHLMGDRYCPMHTAHLDDKGGNTVTMKWFGRNTNLHSVWDGKIIESQGYSYTEYAQKLEHEYGWERKQIERMSKEQTLLRNYHLMEEIYAYQQSYDGNAYHYIYRWRRDMEEQLYIAGIRLAKLLNSIF